MGLGSKDLRKNLLYNIAQIDSDEVREMTLILDTWEIKLNEMGFLREWNISIHKRLHTLKPPLKIRFSNKVVEKIREKYRPRFEIGGILLARPTLKNGDRTLEVKKVVFLRNLSPTPEKSFHFDKREALRLWKENSETDKEYYIPIHFHSHPFIDIDRLSNVHSIIPSLAPLTTSEKDQKTSLGLDIKIKEVDFLIPSALVVKSELVKKRTVIGFYGGGITPTNFGEYMIKLTGQTIKETWDMVKAWVDEDPSRGWILIVLGFLLGLLIVLRPKQAIPTIFVIFILLVTSQIIPLIREEGNYFGALEKGLTIEIPEYSPAL